MKLDLHGIRHEKVRNILDSHIYKNNVPFEVITGNSMEMQKIVISVLKEYDLGYFYINSGSLVVIEKSID